MPIDWPRQTSTASAVIIPGELPIASGTGLGFPQGPSESVLPRKEKAEAGKGAVVTAGAGRVNVGLLGGARQYLMACLVGFVMLMAV